MMQGNCYYKIFLFCIYIPCAFGILTILWKLSRSEFEMPHRASAFIEPSNDTTSIKRRLIDDSDEVADLYQYLPAELEATNGLAQDNPQLLEYVQKNFLIPPVANEVEYNLEQPEVKDPSMGQSKKVIEIFKNKKNGFFIECGALDGETRSNTLYLEKYMGWEGLLVEADPSNFQLVVEKNRKAWLAPTCLSIKRYPLMVTFMQHFNIGKIGDVVKDINTRRQNHVVIQCIPITSLLLALNRTHVDYFSLDVEGHELEVLETIDFDIINIEVFSVEFVHGKKGKETLKKFMEGKGYTVDSEITHEKGWANDYIFKKNAGLSVPLLEN